MVSGGNEFSDTLREGKQEMDKYGYVLKRNQKEKKEEIRYHRTDLELMTTYQLKEICRREKIIQGILNPLDKEELIRTILRYRGAEEYFLIRKPCKNGASAVEEMFALSHFKERKDLRLVCNSKIVVYEGASVEFYDQLTLPFEKRLVGTNAFVISGDGAVCGVFNVMQKGSQTDWLYLTKAADLPCRESEVKNYSLYCLERRESEIFYQIYYGKYSPYSGHLEGYRVPLLNFTVKKRVTLSMSAAIDFGTSNTTGGVYLDNRYFEKAGIMDGEKGLLLDKVNYALFYDTMSGWQETALLPSVVGVQDLQGEQPELLFGYDAIRLADSSYIDEGFCVFYDIKRWAGDYEKQEEITDRQGRRRFVARKDILKAYFQYVITAIENRFKCVVETIHISCPVKQKVRFAKLFEEILPGVALSMEEMIDEGIAVLYNSISDRIGKGLVQSGEEYQALVIDCGGGTTDLCSCRFRVWDRQVAYRVEIHTAYENGDTDFGGNNLTFRILQLLKLAIVEKLWCTDLKPIREILAAYDQDVFRAVDQNGVEMVYQELEAEYRKAEKYLPTRFKEFENHSRTDYFKVKNNYYFLFQLAERVKKEFYQQPGSLRAALSFLEVKEEATIWIPVDKWKLSGRGLYRQGGFDEIQVIKEFPVVYVSIYELELLLRADIYGILQKFMERMYEEEELEDYSMIRLTGQSCRIGIFRDALKEFVPGRAIRSGYGSKSQKEDYGMKMTCVDGALKYLKDKKYGFADIVIQMEEPALPYEVTAYTHTGEELTLIHAMEKGSGSGRISRNMEDLTLKLYLKDFGGKERYQYTCESSLSDFNEMEYEEINSRYQRHILQEDTDDIVENEVRFFVWSEPEKWAFLVVPVYRKERRLYLGKEERFYFENEGWVRNFFDGSM